VVDLCVAAVRGNRSGVISRRDGGVRLEEMSPVVEGDHSLDDVSG